MIRQMRLWPGCARGTFLLRTGKSSAPRTSFLPPVPAAWGPDGEHLAVVRRSDTDQPLSDSIVVVRSKSGEQHTISKGDSPAWSPDGQWIAYLVNHSRTRDDVTIELIHPDGSGERELFRSHERGTYSRGWGPHPEGLPEGPLVWSPDSKAVAFSRRYDRGASIWLVEIA